MEARLLTGPSFLIIGMLMIWIAARLWLVHPINRVFRLGPYVTEEGLSVLLGMRPLFLSYGLLGVISGASRCIYWFAVQSVNAPIVVFLGSLEAGLAAWAALLTMQAAVLLWRAR